MPVREWHLSLEDGLHTVVYEVSTFGGKRTITVDNVRQIEETRRPWEMGADIPFRINQHTGAVHMRSGMLRTKYDLSIDGVSIETGQPAAALLPLPGWAWIFIGACALIPIITLGGAVPLGSAPGAPLAAPLWPAIPTGKHPPGWAYAPALPPAAGGCSLDSWPYWPETE